MDALQANVASPFFLSVNLDVPRLSKPADGSKLHIRSNVPRDLELQALTELADRYGGYAAMDQEFGKLLAALDRTRRGERHDCGIHVGSGRTDRLAWT